jgi:multiple sugar transport system substrate-binding protein
MNNRKLIIIFLALALVFCLVNISVFCAQTQKISVWIGWSQLLPVYEEAAADFKAEMGKDVEVLAFPLREFERKLAVSVPTGHAPDVFVTSEYIIPQYIEAGYVMEPPKEVGEFIKTSFDPITLGINTFNGKIYGVPQIGIARILYWNKELFKEAGLPGPPKNWEELVEYAEKLTVYDSDGKVVCTGICLRKFGGGSGVTEKFQILLASAGGGILKRTSDGKWCAAYNDEAGRATLKLYIDLIHKYKTDSFDTKQDAEAFALGHTAMFIREFWPIPYFKATAPDLKFGTILIPGRKEGESGTVYSTESAFVPKSSKNAEIAWEFIMFFNQEKYVKKMFEDIGWPAPRIDLDFSDIYSREEAYAIANERPEGYIYSTYPPIPAADEIWTKLGERLEAAYRDASLVDNPESIKKVLNEAAIETNNILGESDLY